MKLLAKAATNLAWAALFFTGPNLFSQAARSAPGVCAPVVRTDSATRTTADTLLAQKALVRALGIYVAFPEQPSQLLPEVVSRLETELPNFIRCMSEGRQRLVVETALRPTPFSALCYVTDSTMAYYQKRITKPPPNVAGIEVLTDEILDKVNADDPDFSTRYDVIFFNLLGNFFSGVDGFSLLVRGSAWEQRYTGLGTTNELTDPEVFLGIVGHEYGHLLGAQHPPHFLEKSFGDYELMDQNLHRLAPYGLQNLLDIGWIAPERVQVVNDTLYNVALDDVRRGGNVLLVEANHEQYFLIANHQGSDYDSVYAGRGLLIWHQAGDTPTRAGHSIWDIESAAGLFREGSPDPFRGLDELDGSRSFAGDARDFFHPLGAKRFASDTNPNTNLYERVNTYFDWLTQTQPSGVAIENIRQVHHSIVFDILVQNHPPQISEVHGPSEYVEPFENYNVTANVIDDHSQVSAELYYRHSGERDFRVVAMEQKSAVLFSALLPAPPLSKSVEYYVRARDLKGVEAVYPANAPSQTLRFFIKITLDEVFPLDSLELTARAGELLQVPLPLSNTSAAALQISNGVVLHESVDDERASTTAAVASHVYVPYAFFDVASTRNPRVSFERAPAIYLRSQSGAAARLHFIYTETTFYVYFIRLQPREQLSSLVLNLYWRDPDGREQEVWFTIGITGNLQIGALPLVPLLNATHVGGSSATLPRVLLTISMSALRSSPQVKDWAFRVEMFDEPNTRAYWPSAVVSDALGALFLQEATPYIFFDDESWAIQPQALTTQYLYVDLPSRPWSKEIHGGLFVKIPILARNAKYIPFKITISNFRPWSEPDTTGETDPPDSSGSGASTIPKLFQMRNVYPNPLVLTDERKLDLHLRFDLPVAALVRVEVFDLLGKRVAHVTARFFEAGRHELQWNGSSLRTGIYFIRLQAGSKHAVQKLVVI